MSDIYSGGVRATAITAITAAINARIVTVADGSKDLDRESLEAWLNSEFLDMLNDGEATSPSYVASIDKHALVINLSNAIRKENFNKRADWPNANTATTGPANAAAVREQQAKLKGLADAITGFYANTATEMFSIITGYLESNVEANVPPGVQRVVTDRAYVVVYKTDWGELSAPSPATEVIQVDQNDTVDIVVPAPPGGRHITHFLPYRSNRGVNTGAAYLYIPHPTDTAGWPIADLSILDDLLDSELKEPLPSLTWLEPPATLKGLKRGSNGAMAGFTGKTFCACVNNRPYAFPLDRQRTTEHEIVALGQFGDTWVVLTKGTPYLATAAETSTMSFEKMDAVAACVSAAGVVDLEDGVIGPTPTGLALYSAGGIKDLTGEGGWGLWDREQWQALGPTTIRATVRDGCYIFSCTGGNYSINLRNGRLRTLTAGGSAFYRDQSRDQPYAASGTAINSLFTSGTKRTGIWEGPMAAMNGFAQFSYLSVKDDKNETFGSAVTVKITHGSTLHDTRVVSTSKPVRTKSGRTDDVTVRVESQSKVTRVTLTSSASLLKNG